MPSKYITYIHLTFSSSLKLNIIPITKERIPEPTGNITKIFNPVGGMAGVLTSGSKTPQPGLSSTYHSESSLKM
jgi:hypothetical protein